MGLIPTDNPEVHANDYNGGINNDNIALDANIGFSKLATMSGDVTITNAGVTTIGDAKVTSRKAKLTTAINATAGDQTTTSSTFADVTNASITVTPAVSSNVLIWVSGNWSCDTVDKTMSLQILRDSTLVGVVKAWDAPRVNDGQDVSMLVTDAAVTAAAHTYKVQIKSNDNTASVRAYGLFISALVLAA